MHNKDLISYTGELIHSHIDEKCKLLGHIRNLNLEKVDMIQSMTAQSLVEQKLRKDYNKALEDGYEALKQYRQEQEKLKKILSIISNNTDINIIRNRTLKVMVGVK